MRRFCILIIAIFVCFNINVNGQLFTVPYQNNFDNPGDTTGWSHYSLSGVSYWERSAPCIPYFCDQYSPPYVWVTIVNGGTNDTSNFVLETPCFDLSDTAQEYTLSFYHKRQTGNPTAPHYFIEYSDDNGTTWQILNYTTAKKINWQQNTGFYGNAYANFERSLISLASVQGQDSIKFRFRYKNIPNGSGWMIDNFRIAKDEQNINAVNSDTISVTKRCPNFVLTTTIGFNNEYSTWITNTTQYYLSNDTIPDSSDIYLTSKSSTFFQPQINNWSQTISTPANLHAGFYYIIYHHDALNVLPENNESDNFGYAVLKCDSIYNLPYADDLENLILPWNTTPPSLAPIKIWTLGKGLYYHIDGAHSGKNAWNNTMFAYYGSGSGSQFLATPYFDLTSDTGNLVFGFWYKNNGSSFLTHYSDNCGYSCCNLATVPVCQDDEWDFVNISLNSLSSRNCIRFLFEYGGGQGIIFDDVYIGIAKPDISLERDKDDRFTSSGITSDSLKYLLVNSGTVQAPSAVTAFYWSNDSIFDSGDIFLGAKAEPLLAGGEKIWTHFVYSKPVNTAGMYYIFYVLDTSDILDEMREYNNIGCFTVFQENPFTIPYFNDFETQTDEWRHNSSLGKDLWLLGFPDGILFDTVFSGTKAWISNDTGSNVPMSRMHLYTPVFNMSLSPHPVVLFDMKMSQSIWSNGIINMSYSKDGGATWAILGTTAETSYNRWYNTMVYDSDDGKDVVTYAGNTDAMFALSEPAFAPTFTWGNGYNGRDADRSTKFILDIPFLSGCPGVQFRFNIVATENDSSKGALIDNFSIQEARIDLTVKHKKYLMISSLSQKIKFFMNIKNQGNYISGPSLTKYYLSADTVWDGSDFSLGQVSVPQIRPDMSYYINEIFNAPANLANYNYLIYKVDANNTNAESSELNNTGCWNLALDSIASYPYFMDFNDTVVNGWHHYVKTYTGVHWKDKFRFRNMVVPGEGNELNDRKSGQMFTDKIGLIFNTNYLPFWYLESPSFDFSKTEKISLSFDLMCIGYASGCGLSDDQGGNFEFSTDGGNTWTLLTTQYGQAYNWYDFSSLGLLFYQPGWSGYSMPNNIATLDSTAFDISFLKGTAHVVFRFKFRAAEEIWNNGSAQGMRIDNFSIEGFSIDYEANDSLVPVDVPLTQTGFDINYSVTNTGQLDGPATTVKFFWSSDSILNNTDSLISTFSISPIVSGNTFASSAHIMYPIPVTQAAYYLFYLADADSGLVETDELNNIGSYKITFPYNSVNENTIDNNDMYVYVGNLYINIPDNIADNSSFDCCMTDAGGSLVYHTEIGLKAGINILQLPDNLSRGTYLISIKNQRFVLSKKIFF